MQNNVEETCSVCELLHSKKTTPKKNDTNGKGKKNMKKGQKKVTSFGTTMIMKEFG